MRTSRCPVTFASSCSWSFSASREVASRRRSGTVDRPRRLPASAVESLCKGVRPHLENTPILPPFEAAEYLHGGGRKGHITGVSVLRLLQTNDTPFEVDVRPTQIHKLAPAHRRFHRKADQGDQRRGPGGSTDGVQLGARDAPVAAVTDGGLADQTDRVYQSLPCPIPCARLRTHGTALRGAGGS